MKNKFIIHYGNPLDTYWRMLHIGAEIHERCRSTEKSLHYLDFVVFKSLPLQSRRRWRRNK